MDDWNEKEDLEFECPECLASFRTLDLGFDSAECPECGEEVSI